MVELLAQRVAAVARQHPQREALIEGDVRLSYGEFWSRAVALSGHLRRVGLVRGGRVALILPSGTAAAIAVYGTWLAGGIVVPLNVQARARDFKPWLEHSDPNALIYEAKNAEARKAHRRFTRSLAAVLVGRGPAKSTEASWDEVTGTYHLHASPDHLEPSAPATIVYTSGTTGRPKGVTLTHGNLAVNTGAIIKYLGLSADDSVVSVLPYYYSYGASVLHSHLAVGARVVLESSLVYPHKVAETMARERVSGFSGVSSTYALLLSRVDLTRYSLGSLRYLTQAGGPMPPALIRRLGEALPSARLFVMYGQTEATARLAYLEPEDLMRKLGSVGKAIDGVTIEIRDQDGTGVSPGTTGEVWARGGNVMAGYWRDPEATAETLKDGWLRTGDMGYVDEDGFLFLAGRRSDMIKTGAHRVHPQDIEEAIMELPSVLEVAVVGVDDEVLGQAVKAFVVLAQGRRLNEMQVKAYCLKQLASYKVPKHVEFVASLPRTPTGKTQRFVLESQ